MKRFLVPFLVSCFPIVFSTSADAQSSKQAPKGKPTYESCNALAAQRGFGPESGSGSRPAAKRDFMADCMAGKIR